MASLLLCVAGSGPPLVSRVRKNRKGGSTAELEGAGAARRPCQRLRPRCTLVLSLTVALALTGDAAAGSPVYTLAAVKSCLTHAGVAVSVDATAVPGTLVPDGSRGSLEWDVPPAIAEVSDVSVFLEFGKSHAEAARLRNDIVKSFGVKVADAGSVVDGNVLIYADYGQLTAYEHTTIEQCLR